MALGVSWHTALRLAKLPGYQREAAAPEYLNATLRCRGQVATRGWHSPSRSMSQEIGARQWQHTIGAALVVLVGGLSSPSLVSTLLKNWNPAHL